MSKTSRRAVLAGLAAAPLASSAAASAAGSDAELRCLWGQYVAELEAERIAHERIKLPRAAFDAECPPLGSDAFWEARKPLWDKHGLEPLYGAWNATCDAMRKTITAIRATPAGGLFGIGVKLAALPADSSLGLSEEEYQEAIAATLADINRLAGTDFPVVEHEDDGDEVAA
jgi:hypothetical protein